MFRNHIAHVLEDFEKGGLEESSHQFFKKAVAMATVSGARDARERREEHKGRSGSWGKKHVIDRYGLGRNIMAYFSNRGKKYRCPRRHTSDPPFPRRHW